jgi:hypothetical protein
MTNPEYIHKTVTIDIGSLLSNTVLVIVVVISFAYVFYTWLKYKRLYLEYVEKKKVREEKKKDGGK